MWYPNTGWCESREIANRCTNVCERTMPKNQLHVPPFTDNAIVVRGGINTPELVRRGIDTHPSGAYGVSVRCGENIVDIAVLASGLRNNQVCITTVGEIRAKGGDVIRTSGKHPHHATLIGLSPEVASALLRPPLKNRWR